MPPKRTASPAAGAKKVALSPKKNVTRSSLRLREALDAASKQWSSSAMPTAAMQQNSAALPNASMPTAKRTDHPLGAYDTIVEGTVYTGLEEAWAECVAFDHSTGRIAFVGSLHELFKQTSEGSLQRSDSCHVMEAKGLVMPAFHDAHCHPFGAGNRQRQKSATDSSEDDRLREGAMDLSACKTKRRIEEMLAKKCKENIHPEVGPTILGEACPAGIYEGSGLAARLEKVSPGRPLVLLVGSESHEVLVNETALAALPQLCRHWDYLSIDPAIERTETGSPTGRFRSAFWASRFALLSAASMASKGFRGLVRGLRELPRHGIVACTDAFVFADRVPMYELAFEQDAAMELPRTSLAIGFKSHWSEEETCAMLERVKHLRRSWDETGNRFCIREVKVEVDNLGFWSSSSRFGGPSWDLDMLDRVVEEAVAANFSIHLHVFGDLAAKHSLESLRRAESKAARTPAAGVQQRRHKLAHVFELLPEDEAALSSGAGIFSSSVTAVFQPFWFSDRAWTSYEDEATQMHQRLVGGGAACYGSDWDISNLSPLEGVEAVLRRPGTLAAGAWHERLARAIRLQTFDAAHAMWLESDSGTLAAGKFADICILDTNIFNETAIVEEGSEWSVEAPIWARTVATISAGALIFQRSDTSEREAERELPAAALEALLPSRRVEENEILRSTCSCREMSCLGGARRARTRAGANKWCSVAFSGRTALEVKA